MCSNKILYWLAAGALSCALVDHASAVPIEIQANGSFEDGFTGWWGTYGITKAASIHGSYTGIVVAWTSSSIRQPLYQMLPTIPGQTYTITFALRGGGGIVGQMPPGPPAAVTVKWGDTDMFWTDTDLGEFQNLSQTEWKYFQIEAVAPSASTRLSFYNDHDHNYPLIDDIRVTHSPSESRVSVADPAPTISLLAAGIGLLIMFKRQR